MKILFTSKGNSWNSDVDPRLGRAVYLFCYNEEDKQIDVLDNSEIRNEAHGAGPKTVQKIFDMEPDIIITGNGPGDKAANLLMRTDIKIFTGAWDMSLEDAYKAYKNGDLKEFVY